MENEPTEQTAQPAEDLKYTLNEAIALWKPTPRQHGTGVYASEPSPGVFVCPPAHLVPGTPEAAVHGWSPATRELVADRQARERAAQTGGAR